MDRLKISENVPAEIAERLSDVAARGTDIPNFADEDDLHGVVNKALHAPLAQLFSTRDQIRGIRSIGALNHDRAIEWLLKDLAEVERALRRIWESA